jgi:hypothetical protein
MQYYKYREYQVVHLQKNQKYGSYVKPRHFTELRYSKKISKQSFKVSRLLHISVWVARILIHFMGFGIHNLESPKTSFLLKVVLITRDVD